MRKDSFDSTTLDSLRRKVIEKGQKTNDLKKISSDILNLNPQLSWMLMGQIQRDAYASYKYYDALAMWLGQAKYWTEKDREILEQLANAYIKEGKDIEQKIYEAVTEWKEMRGIKIINRQMWFEMEFLIYFWNEIGKVLDVKENGG